MRVAVNHKPSAVLVLTLHSFNTNQKLTGKHLQRFLLPALLEVTREIKHPQRFLVSIFKNKLKYTSMAPLANNN